MWPNIIVALVFIPRLCPADITSSHCCAVALPKTDPTTDVLGEHLAAAAGDRVQPSFDHAVEDHAELRVPDILRQLMALAGLGRRESFQLKHRDKLNKLRRAEPVDVYTRELGLDPRKHLLIKLDRQVRVHPPLQEHLRAANIDQLPDLLV